MHFFQQKYLTDFAQKVRCKKESDLKMETRLVKDNPFRRALEQNYKLKTKLKNSKEKLQEVENYLLLLRLSNKNKNNQRSFFFETDQIESALEQLVKTEIKKKEVSLINSRNLFMLRSCVEKERKQFTSSTNFHIDQKKECKVGNLKKILNSKNN